ncbi:MAG: hypothetical protein JW797_11635 [Bradymonadales bacterium]|nr:hypothetical protein [Bradymonadales bacterium]
MAERQGSEGVPRRGIRDLEGLLFVLLMLAVSFWYALPFFRTPLLPCMDSPAHLALATAMRHLGQTGHILDQTFRWGEFPAPNSAFYLIVYGLSGLIGPLLAERCICLLWVVSLPWAFCYFLTAFGRNRWLSFLAFPMVLMWPFTEGFVDYCLGLVLVLAGLGLLRRHLREPTWLRRVLVFLASGAIFLTHIQAFVYYGVGAILLLLLAAIDRPWRPSVFRALLWLIGEGVVIACLGVGLAVLWMIGSGKGLVEVAGIGGVTDVNLESKLEELWEHTLLVLRGTKDAWIAISLVLAGGWLGLWWRLLGVPPEEGLSRRRRAVWQVPLMLLLLFGALYPLLPIDFGLYYNLHSRLPAFLMLLAGCLLAPAGWRLRSRLIGVIAVLPLLAAVAYTPYQWRPAFQKLEATAEGFWQVLASAPKQSRLLYYVEHTPDTGFTSNLLRHLGQYHTVVNEGITSFSFAEHPGRLIVQRQLGFDVEQVQAGDLTRRDLLARYEVLLHRGRSHLERRANSRFELLDRVGEWSLYRISAEGQGLDEGLVTTVGGGGTGGEIFGWNCPAGEVLIGVSGRIVSNMVESLRPHCQSLEALRAGDDRAEITRGPSFGAGRQGAGLELICPSGQATVGIYGSAGTLIHQLGLVCAEVQGESGPPQIGPPLRQEVAVGEPLGVPFEGVCPQGTVVGGIRGRAGTLVDACYLACFPLER